MDKLVAIRIKHDDGTYSNEIPLSVLAVNIDWDGTHNLVDVLGNVDLNKGSIQEQINALTTTITPDNVQYDLTHTLSDVLGDVDLDKGDLQTQIDNISDGEIQVDSTLTAAGKAADAKAVGDNLKNVVRVGNSNVTNFTSIILGDTEEQVNLLDQSDLIDINARLSALEGGGAGSNVQVDQTLSIQGKAAQSKTVGDAISRIEEEIDNKQDILTNGSITYEKLANDVINYLTPQMFGAVGDGTADDTVPIQTAINYAKTNNVALRGYKRYKTTEPIIINATYLDLEIERITYTGNKYALSITGSYNNIKINMLYCSYGKGIIMTRPTSSGSCQWNKITIMRLFAHGNGVEFVTNNQFIIYNTFDIRVIKSDTGNCYSGENRVGENVFMNTTCTCPEGWAIYKCGGRFYNFTLEADVLNGIYPNNNSIFVGFRHRELTDKLVYRINGTQPNITGGILIKFVGAFDTPIKYISNDVIPYEAIDVSEMYAADEIIDAGLGMDEIGDLSFFNEINAPICYGNWDTKNGYIVIGRKMLVTGGKKICIPAYETEYTITDADYDMRDLEVVANRAKIYPTKMTIGVDNCVIHLSTSYCAYGYSDFIVDQTQGHLCTIYDANDDDTPIFDGETLGMGVYKLHAYCDPTVNAIIKFRPDYLKACNDAENYFWEIKRIDAIGGGSSVGIISVSDYGAVGDGIADDSQAIQDACDAGYDIYFESNKTYYLASTVTINHDVKIHGGENTTIKTKTPTGGIVNNAIDFDGTLKKTTTLTTDYTSNGNTDNCNNKFTLADMTGINIGDIMVIVASDQYYSYARQYYYLGASLLITDIYDGHIYTSESMPWNIENTANVSVKIYNAPSVVVENLRFESDLDSRGNYRYLLQLHHCKNSTIKDCTFTQMDNGIRLHECVNTLVSNVSLSKSKYDNALSGDGYGLAIYSCTDTIVERMLATCAQHAITISGNEPSMNTRVRNCDLTAECRNPGFDCHENAYNTVLEDCVLGTATLHGTAHVNRCRIINNRRANAGTTYLSLNGSHNPEWARFRITNTVFEGTGINLATHEVQTPIQAFDNIWGSIEIENCLGGDELVFCPETSESVLSNRLQNLVIKNWKNGRGIKYLGDSPIDFLNIIDSTFRETTFISDHVSSHGVITDGIKYFDLSSVYPSKHKISVDTDTYGETHILPKDTRIQLSSDNSSAIFRICGTNLTPNIRDDYRIGSITGSNGGEISRSNYTGSNVTLTIDNNGDPIFVQASNFTGKYSFYPIGMFYVSEFSTVKISAKVKNTGNTNGAGFSPTIAILDCETGLLTSRNSGTSVTASTDGVSMSYSTRVDKDHAVLCYCYCNSPIAGSETTFEDFNITCTPLFAPNVVDDQYNAKRLTGNGTILSLEGVNNIMCSETIFHVKFQADLLK